MQYAYAGRKMHSRRMRREWIQSINAAAKQQGLRYNELMGSLADSGIRLNRAALATLAQTEPYSFASVCGAVHATGMPALMEKREQGQAKLEVLRERQHARYDLTPEQAARRQVIAKEVEERLARERAAAYDIEVESIRKFMRAPTKGLVGDADDPEVEHEGIGELTATLLGKIPKRADDPTRQQVFDMPGNPSLAEAQGRSPVRRRRGGPLLPVEVGAPAPAADADADVDGAVDDEDQEGSGGRQ